LNGLFWTTWEVSCFQFHITVVIEREKIPAKNIVSENGWTVAMTRARAAAADLGGHAHAPHARGSAFR